MSVLAYRLTKIVSFFPDERLLTLQSEVPILTELEQLREYEG